MPLIHTYQDTHRDFAGILVGSCALFCWLSDTDIALSVFFPQGMIVWDVFDATSQKMLCLF